jgi:30S ribosome assembly GTPase
MTDMLRCQGCGTIVQTERPDEPGYLPKSALGRPEIVCRRCYRITHYGEFSRQVVDPAAYEREIAAIQAKPGLVLYVLDVFDLAGSMATGLTRVLRGSEVHLVVNKVDLLPADVDSTRLTQWIREEVASRGIEAKGVHFVSAERGTGVEDLLRWLEAKRHNAVYVVGMANVGKSTLLNQLKGLASGGEAGGLTVSLVPGTTLGTVRMEWRLRNQRKVQVSDTPGLIRGDRLTDYLCTDCLKVVVPTRRMKPRVFQLEPGQSLWFGNVCRFDFTAGLHQPVVCYVSNDLVIHRTKLERAAQFGADHPDDILKVPCPTCRERLGPLHEVSVATAQGAERWDDTTVHLEVSRSGADIVLPGLGWMALSGTAFTGSIWLPIDLTPTTRRRLIGDLNRSQQVQHQAVERPSSRR